MPADPGVHPLHLDRQVSLDAPTTYTSCAPTAAACSATLFADGPVTDHSNSHPLSGLDLGTHRFFNRCDSGDAGLLTPTTPGSHGVYPRCSADADPAAASDCDIMTSVSNIPSSCDGGSLSQESAPRGPLPPAPPLDEPPPQTPAVPLCRVQTRFL